MKFETTHAPRVVSTSKPATTVVNAQGEDALVAALIAEYGPQARAKAVADRAAAKAKTSSDAAHAKVLAQARAYVARHKGV